jgi:nicotinate phosphoribosyltransferase
MTSVRASLLLDLYQITMGQAYFHLGMKETAVFELFVRRLPGCEARYGNRLAIISISNKWG